MYLIQIRHIYFIIEFRRAIPMEGSYRLLMNNCKLELWNSLNRLKHTHKFETFPDYFEFLCSFVVVVVFGWFCYLRYVDASRLMHWISFLFVAVWLCHFNLNDSDALNIIFCIFRSSVSQFWWKSLYASFAMPEFIKGECAVKWSPLEEAEKWVNDTQTANILE